MPRKPHRIGIHPAVVEFLAKAGKKGGKAKGACKRRGDSEHYRKLTQIRDGKPTEPKP